MRKSAYSSLFCCTEHSLGSVAGMNFCLSAGYTPKIQVNRVDCIAFCGQVVRNKDWDQAFYPQALQGLTMDTRRFFSSSDNCSSSFGDL